MATKTEERSASQEKSINPAGLVHLGIVYLVWSSTYLAIRIGVREGAGFPPFTLGLMRVAFAAAILLIWARLTKQRIKPTRSELGVLVISGILLWTGGNGLVMWGEQRADSSLAALLIAAVPIWGAIIEAILDRKLPTWGLVLPLLLGFSGIGLLAAPSLMSGVRADLLSMAALLFAPISWALGSVLQTHKAMSLGPRASSAYQMLAGGVGFLVLIILMDEPLPTPTPAAWLAWAYLVIVGAVVAFTSYITALRLLPTNIVMTYAYVNPVLATVLGWIVLGEEITGWTVVGTILVLLGVAGVFRNRYNQ